MADGSPGQFDIGNVVSNIISVVRGTLPSMWPVVVGFILAPQLLVAIFQMIFIRSASNAFFLGPTPSPFLRPEWPFSGSIFGAGVIAGLVGLAGSIALFYSSTSFLNGRTTTAREAISQIGPLYLSIFGASILVGLGVGLASLLLVIPGIFLSIAWSVMVPVRVMERVDAVGAIGRSYRLTSSFRWPIFGVFLILICAYAAVLLVLGVVELILGLVGLKFAETLIVGPVIACLASMFGAAAPSAIYHELIRIKEGGGSSVADVFV